GISASVLEADRLKSEQAGMNGLVNKPVGSEELSELLQSLDLAQQPEPTMPVAQGPNIGEEQAAIARVRSQLGEGWLTAARGFVDMASNQVQHMRDAARRSDRLALQDLAHSLKGSAASLGFVRIAELAGQTEQSGNLAPADADTLERYLSEVREQQVERGSVTG
ncbi:MAG: Hpt domain-containing protein, partial [Gammaproteobacteria bacterium]